MVLFVVVDDCFEVRDSNLETQDDDLLVGIIKREKENNSNGWNYQDKPIPNCEVQRKQWEGATWLSCNAYLIGNKVIYQ